MDVTITVNSQQRTLNIEPRMTLLDVLRENLGLVGSKKGCDHGQCGACTVLIDGQRVYSCLALAVMQEGNLVISAILLFSFANFTNLTDESFWVAAANRT